MENKKGIELLKAACETVIREDRVGMLVREAIAAAERGDIDFAIDQAKKAAGLNPLHTDPAVILGVLLLHERSQRIPAMGYFNQVIRDDSNNALALWYLASDKLRGGRIHEALALLTAASECEPVDSYVVTTLAWLLNMLGKVDQAKSIIHKKLLNGQVQLICQTMALLLESQEIDLRDEALNYLFKKSSSCLIDLGCVADSPGYDERWLESIMSISNSALSTKKQFRRNLGCLHLANPALELYKQRYSKKVAEHYVSSFLSEILVSEIMRIFRKNDMGKQRSLKDKREIPPEMVLVPAGLYTVGAKNVPSLNHPERKCVLSAFLIDKYPVTNKQWREFQPNHTFPRELENNPVTNVDFIQATMYARWKGKRLPTEVEWEAAARGPMERRFPWGDNPVPSLANCADNKQRRTTPVTKYPQGASPFGAMDMLGNACEWVDEWGPPASNGQLANRIAKGGGFTFTAANLACWLRMLCSPINKHPNIGFRCVLGL